MSEGWFYRETAGARERGPVTKSDLEYLQTQGTIRPGMEIRSEFGEWSAVSSGSGIKPERRDPSAAALPRVAKAKAKAATVSPPSSDSPPVPPVSKAVAVGRNSNKQIAIAAGVIVASALLIFLLLTATNGTGIESNAGQDVVDGSEEKETNTSEPASIPAGQPSGSDNGDTASAESQSAGADASKQNDGDSAGTSDATPDVPGSTSVVSGSQPTPLNRNVNRKHVISPGAEFFGVRATGRRFIFLIDASSSMLDGKDQAARRELIASVGRMDPGMELEVIFFTTTITRVFGQFASLKDRDNIIDKIANATPLTGGTPVMPALREAIRMNPDAVFLLTDGAFNEGDISAETRSLNSENIPINTIAFVDRSMESVLKRVASDSGGDYRYVAR
mgnify:FL=1